MEAFSLAFIRSFCGSGGKSHCGRNTSQVPNPHIHALTESHFSATLLTPAHEEL